MAMDDTQKGAAIGMAFAHSQGYDPLGGEPGMPSTMNPGLPGMGLPQQMPQQPQQMPQDPNQMAQMIPPQMGPQQQM